MVILGQDARQKAANLGQDVRGMAAADAQGVRALVDRNRDLPVGMDERVGDRANCYQDARQDHRCNTRFLHVRVPLYLVPYFSGFLNFPFPFFVSTYLSRLRKPERPKTSAVTD